MNTREHIIDLLEQFRTFFIAHNEIVWAKECERTISKVSKDNSDLNEILRDFSGAGMGSLIDLYICKENGHAILSTEQDANKQLSLLRDRILAIKHVLERRR